MKKQRRDLSNLKKVKRKKQLADRAGSNYIDNKDFFNEVVAYKTAVANNNGQRVAIPDKLALYFFKIAQNLATKGNFINYSFKDDMISDGVENCIQYIYNFDPKKSSNPFSYFTQIIYYAFVRRIKKEKKQMYIKYKSFIESELSENEEVLNMLQKNDCLKDYKREFIANFESSIEKKKEQTKKRKTKSLGLFFESDDDIVEDENFTEDFDNGDDNGEDI